MAGKPDQLAGNFETENAGGLLSGLLAEEDDFDRRSLWRLGSWGVGAVGAVVIAVLANQSSVGWRRDQVAAADLARQTQQIQFVAKESQNETRRLAYAIDTLNGDRDRLYSRVTSLEQGLDSVTGSIARQNSGAGAPPVASPPAASTEPQPVTQNAAPAPPAVAAVATAAPAATEKPRLDVAEPVQATVASATTSAMPLMASKSIMAPPDSAAGKLIEPQAPANAVTAAPMPEVVGSIPPADNAELDTKVDVQRTEFAVDVGTARSIGGLRVLWRGLLKSNAALATLRPVIAVKEGNNGLGMQLRLVAGPLGDAAAAAKICAALIEGQRTCETTVFDGQRLAMTADQAPASVKPASIKPVSSKPSRRRGYAKPAATAVPEKKPDGPTLSSLFGRR